MDPAIDSALHCERDDGPENCEIEITPEMTEAGAEAFLWGWTVNDAEIAAEAIFVAMYKVMKRCPALDC